MDSNSSQLCKTSTKSFLKNGKQSCKRDLNKATTLKTPHVSSQVPSMSLMFFPMQTNCVSISPRGYFVQAVPSTPQNITAKLCEEVKLVPNTNSNVASLQQSKTSHTFKNNDQILRLNDDCSPTNRPNTKTTAPKGIENDTLSASLQECKTPHTFQNSDLILRSNYDCSPKKRTNTKISTTAPKRMANDTLSCKVVESADINEVKRAKKPVNESFCFVCNVTCGSVELLQMHKEDKEFYCRVCTLKFNNHDELQTHFTSHKQKSCAICKEVFHCFKDFLNHKKANIECSNQTKCNICGKLCTKRSIRAHMKNVHTDKSTCDTPFKCIICNKEYYRSKKLLTHLENSHLAYELLECHICKSLLCGPERLKTHFKTVHVDDDSSWPCKICHKVFSKKGILSGHMKTHKELEKLCEICGKSVLESKMRLHKLKEHAEIGIFPCRSCEEVFDTYYKMRCHSRLHSRYEECSVFCDICGKKYKNSRVLKNHYAIHSEEKPFKCNTCGASFKQKVTLRTHQRVHSDIGKYFCGNCGKSFRWKQTFTKHITKCERNQESFHEQD